VRLENVSRGHAISAKLRLAMIRVMSRAEPVDVIKALSYRPELWGAPFKAWLQVIMRGPSRWSVTERELFAAFTSRLNQCVF
jgi:hypothetical protein